MSTTHGTHWLEREDFGDVTVVRLKTPPVLTDTLTHADGRLAYPGLQQVGQSKQNGLEREANRVADRRLLQLLCRGLRLSWCG